LFCLVFVEQLMAWRFFYGFLLLYLVVGIGFVVQTFVYSAAAFLALFLVFCAGFVALAGVGRGSSGNWMLIGLVTLTVLR